MWTIFGRQKWEVGNIVVTARESWDLDVQSLAGEMLKTCAALVFCPPFWLGTSVRSLLFLLEQNKEVHVLFSSCEMECLLSVDCMQFTEGKLCKRPQFVFQTGYTHMYNTK